MQRVPEMPKKQKKLRIEFSPEQTEKYFNIVSKKTKAEFESDCLPSGVQIVIDILPIFGDQASVNGVDIGEIDLSFIPV